MTGCRGARFAPRICAACGLEYVPSGARQRYCSPDCRREARGLGPPLAEQVRACERCGREYAPSGSRQRYCSPDCRRGGPLLPRSPGRARPSFPDPGWEARMLLAARKRIAGHPERSYADLPSVTEPCRMVLSGKHGSNGRVLLVRCRCQAQTRQKAAEGFFGYDILGEARSLPGAAALWREHASRVLT